MKIKTLLRLLKIKDYFYIADTKVILIDCPICWASKGSPGRVPYVNDGVYIVQQGVVSQGVDKLDRSYGLMNIQSQHTYISIEKQGFVFKFKFPTEKKQQKIYKEIYVPRGRRIVNCLRYKMSKEYLLNRNSRFCYDRNRFINGDTFFPPKQREIYKTERCLYEDKICGNKTQYALIKIRYQSILFARFFHLTMKTEGSLLKSILNVIHY